jgi:adenosylcobinamide-phosphate synthase
VIASFGAPLALAAAYSLDLAFGEPPDAIHPVAWMGHVITIAREWALRSDRVGQLGRGALVALAIPSGAAAAAWGVERATAGHPAIAIVATALLLKPLFAVRALRDAAFVVRDGIARGDLAAARLDLRALCSRPAGRLGPEALAAAAIESVAENASDSVVAPLLFFACFGLPGAAFYRAANTLDAMMGYRGRLEYAGKTAARLDDLLNLVPARVTAALLLLAGAALGSDVRRGAAVLVSDGRLTESPNAGRPMAAMAGILGVRLEKDGHYALGADLRLPGPADITAAWRVASFACAGAAALAAAIAGLRG